MGFPNDACRARFASAVLTVALIHLGGQPAFACSCAPAPPPCQAYAQAQMVFRGTVTKALEERGGLVVRASIRIDKAYKGVTVKSLVLFDNGMCNGPELKVGEQLTDDYFGDDKPLPGALVEMRGPGGVHAATTGGDGGYSFDNLDPAEYSLTAAAQGLKLLTFGNEAEIKAKVEARACAVVGFMFRQIWPGAISGRVVHSNGEPGPQGLSLTLLRQVQRNFDDGPRFIYVNTLETKPDGTYSFSELSPGLYKLVAGLYEFPTARFPYPTTYWPRGRVEADAAEIEVTAGVATQPYDFVLPPEPKSVQLTGVVTAPNGNPVQGVRVMVKVLPHNSMSYQDAPITDAEGKFAFTAFEGFDYELSALRMDTNPMHSATIPYSVKNGPQSVILIMDRPGRFDDDPILLNRGK